MERKILGSTIESQTNYKIFTSDQFVRFLSMILPDHLTQELRLEALLTMLSLSDSYIEPFEMQTLLEMRKVLQQNDQP